MSSSTLRSALRERLTAAMRERDRVTASVMRSTLAALENAEAVPHPGRSTPSGAATAGSSAVSQHVAGSLVGVGAAEVERLSLDEAAESDIVRAEIEGLIEAAVEYAAAGHDERAGEARAAAEALSAVVRAALGPSTG